MEEDLKSKVDNLQSQISMLNLELAAIQKLCKHPKEYESIRNSNPGGTFIMRKMCDICQSVIGYPSQDDMDKLLK